MTHLTGVYCSDHASRPPHPTALNTCNSCDPPIPDTLTVTLSGGTGEFAEENGIHEAQWAFGCTWNFYQAGDLRWYGGKWEGNVYTSTEDPWYATGAYYEGGTDSCGPKGTYSFSAKFRQAGSGDLPSGDPPSFVVS